jgi:chromosome segregation ATPase
VGYRSEELLEKRTQIKVLERDLERLTMDRDSLEEQRDLAEEEIESLEGQVRELEDQIRDHNRTSSMQNGRINVAHARKKRRLDTELERVLETIEQKRINVHDIDDKAFEKAKQRDEKEAEMVQLEKELVQILVEQQRKVLSNIEVLRGSTDEKTRMICHVARLPYPPLVNPSIVDVEEMLRKDQEDRKKKAEEELEFHKMTNRSSAAPGPGPSSNSNSSVKKR